MKYDIAFPPEPDGPLWDTKGDRWEKTVKGFWEPSDKLDNPYRQSLTWKGLLDIYGPLYDSPTAQASWDAIRPNSAYYAELFSATDERQQIAKGLFISGRFKTLTSVEGAIYQRGEVIVRHLREYGTANWEN